MLLRDLGLRRGGCWPSLLLHCALHPLWGFVQVSGARGLGGGCAGLETSWARPGGGGVSLPAATPPAGPGEGACREEMLGASPHSGLAELGNPTGRLQLWPKTCRTDREGPGDRKALGNVL